MPQRATPPRAADPALAETHAAPDLATVTTVPNRADAFSVPTITVVPGDTSDRPLRPSFAPPVDEEGAGEAAAALHVTRAGAVMGTPLYMAPEHLGAGGAVTAAADVYALGAILFEILTLSPYRKPDTLEAMARQAGREQVERPSVRTARLGGARRERGVPAALDDLCARALAPDPAARLASALALAEAVERHLEGDRDEAARRAHAARLTVAARERLAAEPGAAARVAAMRDALQALALAPDDVEVQRLLLSLVVDGSGPLPAEAERELAQGEVEIRRQGTRFGLWGFFSWLAALPLAAWAGFRAPVFPALLTGLTLLAAAYAWRLLRRPVHSGGPAIVLSVAAGVVVALSSGWLGPFVLAPLAACATAVMFVLHSARRERPFLIAVWALTALVPFGVELLGVLPPAYSFRPGELVLHARGLDLPPGPTLAALAYTSVSFLVLLCVFVGRLRDQQRSAERRLFVQAWHLRQLFPASGEAH